MNEDSSDKKMSRKEREFKARREEILKAATRIFAQKGYHGASMSEIAKEAEFSTGSLYNFFKNKEELYFTLLVEKIEGLETQVSVVFESNADVDQKLRLWLDKILSYFEVERDFFRIFVEQRTQFEQSSKGEFADMVFEKLKNNMFRMMAMMKEGVDKGFFKPMDPLELATVFSSILNSVLIVFVNSEQSYPLRGKAELILDVFYNGVRRAPGETPA